MPTRLSQLLTKFSMVNGPSARSSLSGPEVRELVQLLCQQVDRQKTTINSLQEENQKLRDRAAANYRENAKTLRALHTVHDNEVSTLTEERDALRGMVRSLRKKVKE